MLKMVNFFGGFFTMSLIASLHPINFVGIFYTSKDANLRDFSARGSIARGRLFDNMKKMN